MNANRDSSRSLARIQGAAIALLLLLLMPLVMATEGENYVKLTISSRLELRDLTKVISIENVSGLEVYAYASAEQLSALKDLGYTYTILPHPSTLLVPKMATTADEIRDWDSYPTYEAYVSMMYQFEADYPLICDVQNVGYSVEGREIIFARISDNVYEEENEPEVMYISTMHGNETCGYILLLRLTDSLLAGYGSEPRITDMIDNMEIWINPLANPDGTYAGGNDTVEGATRGNANGADLNRNYPDPEDGPHPDGRVWQPETIAMMNLTEENRFVISANFHDGAEVLNYPWDTWSHIHADDQWFQDICHKYADTAQAHSPGSYMEDFDDGVVRGWDWYTINGGFQDYSTFFRGGRNVTIELTHGISSPAELPLYWEYNRVSLLDYLENGRYGIRGLVTEYATGNPIDATITVLNHDIDSARVFTDPDVGDYHRMIEAGVYDVAFSAFGYVAGTIEDVIVSDGYVTDVDFEMSLASYDPILVFEAYDAGLINPGETVDVFLTLTNLGGADAQSPTGTLFTSDTNVTIIQNTATYPDIPRLQGQGTSNTPYQIAISSACPEHHLTEFALSIDELGGYSVVDSFPLLVGQQSEGFESGTFLALPWVTEIDEPWTDVPWAIVQGGAPEGSYYARSGLMLEAYRSTIEITFDVLYAGAITFSFMVSSQENHDFLKFFIDDVQQCRWSGEVPWSEVSFPVSKGIHTFRWQYWKDISTSEGLDLCAIDYIRFPISIVPLLIMTLEVPDWTVGVPYAFQLEATGGIGQYSWVDAYGDLSGTGLSLASSGIVSGVPGFASPIAFTARVSDSAGAYDYRTFDFNINPELIITTLSLPDGFVGTQYSQQLQATGGTGPRVWNDLNGDLNGTGLSLSAAGLLSGVPTSAGSISFVAHVEDEVGAFAESSLAVEVDSAWTCGDADGNDIVNISDVVYLTSYIFGGGPEPQPLPAGDVDCNEIVNISDAVYLIAYIFGGGPEPCAAC